MIACHQGIDVSNFQLYSSVTLCCPHCGDTLQLTAQDGQTIGDVILAAAAHKCEKP